MLTVSEKASLDGARTPPYDKELANEPRRRIFMLDAVKGDADILREKRIRQYGPHWNVLNEYKVARYDSLAPSPEGDATVANEGLVQDYMGSYLRFMNLSNTVTEVAYDKERQEYFDFIKSHLKHRYATGLIGPLVHPNHLGGPLMQPGDIFSETKQFKRDVNFVCPDPTKIRRSGAGFQYAADGWQKTYTYKDWTVEFLFQKKSSWPEIDGKIIKKAGSECTARRYKNDKADYWGFWLSPARYPNGHPSEAEDCFDTFTDAKWKSLKESGYYAKETCRENQTLDILNPEHYSAFWGPKENDYYFDPGHNREDLAYLGHGENDPWFQYQCQILVKSKGTVEVSEGGSTIMTYTVGPLYHSDLFYVEMYATPKNVPDSLGKARQVFGDRYAYAYTPPLTADGKRDIDPPDEALNLFGSPGTPTGLKTPAASYPRTQMDFGPTLPNTFADDANVFYKTGADTNSLIRFPMKGVNPPALSPSDKSSTGFQAYLDKWYPCFAVYYPPVKDGGEWRGPWLVNVLDPSEQGTCFSYLPDARVPGTNPSVPWKSVVYKPTRFGPPLADTVYYLYSSNRGTVKANYGTDAVPGGYKFAMKGAIWDSHPVFEIPTKPTGYKLEAGSLPVPVGYQTMHGLIEDGPDKYNVVAGADCQLCDRGVVRASDDTAQEVVPKMRDNYVFAAVTVSAGCCGTVTQKLVDKKVGYAFLPRANVTVTITDNQSKGGGDKNGSIETLGLWHSNSLASGVGGLPYDPMSVGSRMPSSYAYANYQNNFAALSYDTPPTDAPKLFTDAQDKNVLVSQLGYYAGQSYDLQIAAEPTMGPQVVEMNPAGVATPGQTWVYYCARELKTTVNYMEGGVPKEKIKEVDLIPQALSKGALAGLNTEPPMGSISVQWPREGDYQVVTSFTDCNGQNRKVTAMIHVGKKQFEPNLIGEERKSK